MGRWAAYVVVTGAALYTQYYAAFIPLFHLIFLVLSARRRSQYLYALGSFAVLLVLFAPWLLYAGPKLADYVGNARVRLAGFGVTLQTFETNRMRTF